MPPDDCDYIEVIYRYIDKGKWKSKTKSIKVEELPLYEEKYRVIGTSKISENSNIIFREGI